MFWTPSESFTLSAADQLELTCSSGNRGRFLFNGCDGTDTYKETIEGRDEVNTEKQNG